MAVGRFGEIRGLARQSRASRPVPTPSPTLATEVPPDLDTLFRRFGPYVETIGLRLLGRRHEAEDLVQDVFLAAGRGLTQLRDPCAAKAWLATIAVRSARRRLRRRRLCVVLGVAEPYDYADVAGQEASAEHVAMLSKVYRVLDAMPANVRLAWTLRFVAGEKLARVAVLCDCSLATAKRRIEAARQKIDEAFAT